MTGRWETGGVKLGFIVVFRFRIDHRVLEVHDLPDAIPFDHREGGSCLSRSYPGKWGSVEAPKCMVATAIATLGAIDRTVADSTLAGDVADMPL
jgi:hypothetical protein